MEPSAKRRKYDARFKLQAINFAKENNNCAAARKYGVTEKMIRDWKNKEESLKQMPRNKCALRTGQAQCPILENSAAIMVQEHRQNSYQVTRNNLQIFAIKWAKDNPDSSKRFQGNEFVVFSFFKKKKPCTVTENKNSTAFTSRSRFQSEQFSLICNKP